MSKNELQRIFTENLNYYLSLNQRSQLDLAKYMGLSNTTVNNWCKGYNTPRMDKVDKICQFFGIKRSDLLEEKSKIETPSGAIPMSDFYKIPLYSEIAGGKPIEMNNTVIDYIPVYGIPDNGEYFALKVKGKSMEPKIMDGDVVIIHKQEDAENGETVAISVDGENATCKRLYKYADHISLLSYNTDYPPIEFTEQEIKEKPVHIYGKVIKLMRDL